MEATGEPKQGCLGSLEMLQERNEPWWGCFSSQKRGVGDRFRGLAPEQLWLPAAALVASLLGSLEFRRWVPVGKKRGTGKALACSWEGELLLGPLF